MLDPAAAPGVDEKSRETIHEALILDRSLQMGRFEDAWEAAGIRRN
jgi:hypothetical protein